MPYFDGVSGRVYYRAWPALDARAGVVFLHGYGEHSGLYHRFAGALDRQRISLWALDEIGHGLSDGDRGFVGSIGDLEANGRTLARIAAETDPGLPLVVAGHSLGAGAAALLVARSPAPFRAAVLSGVLLSRPEYLDPGDEEPAGGESGGGLELDAADLSSDPFYLDELANDPLAFTDSEASPLDALGPAWEELGATFAQVSVPVLLVHGELDPIAPVQSAREWAGRVAAARLLELPGARHDVLNETAHRQVADEIARFVLASAG